MKSATQIQKLQKLFTGIALAAILLLPVVSYAEPCTAPGIPPDCTPDTTTDFKSLVTGIVGIMNVIQNFLVALSVFIIIWGTFRYLIASGDKERLTKAKDVIVYGLLGIVIMYSIMGIIKILLGTFQFTGGKPLIPQL